MAELIHRQDWECREKREDRDQLKLCRDKAELVVAEKRGAGNIVEL